MTEIVDGCTEPDILPKSSWQKRKIGYIQQIQYASASVKRVSLADKLHNARSLFASLQQEGDIVWSRFNAGKAQMLWFYCALRDVYNSAGQDYLSQEFVRVMADIETVSNEPAYMT